MAKTDCERQKEAVERREAEGLRRVALWAPAERLEALRRIYEGPRGGIDWDGVIHAALSQGEPPGIHELTEDGPSWSLVNDQADELRKLRDEVLALIHKLGEVEGRAERAERDAADWKAKFEYERDERHRPRKSRKS